MIKTDWEEKIEEITHYFSTREIMLMSPANRILAEQHNRKLFDLKKCICEILSSQLSDLKKEIKKENRYIFLTLDQPKKGESFLKLKDILSLLDKKAGKE